jgi:hypothetical protein
MSRPSLRERLKPYFQPRPRGPSGKPMPVRRAGAAQPQAAPATLPGVAAADGGAPAAPAAPAIGSGELAKRRETLALEMARLHWDLGGLTYEMAIRDHFRLDLLVRQSARLQQVDAELGAIDRMLRLEQAGAAGECPNCGALYPRGAVYCGQCGSDLIGRVTLATPSTPAPAPQGPPPAPASPPAQPAPPSPSTPPPDPRDPAADAAAFPSASIGGPRA